MIIFNSYVSHYQRVTTTSDLEDGTMIFFFVLQHLLILRFHRRVRLKMGCENPHVEITGFPVEIAILGVKNAHLQTNQC